jgi:hypothetical protein
VDIIHRSSVVRFEMTSSWNDSSKLEHRSRARRTQRFDPATLYTPNDTPSYPFICVLSVHDLVIVIRPDYIKLSSYDRHKRILPRCGATALVPGPRDVHTLMHPINSPSTFFLLLITFQLHPFNLVFDFSVLRESHKPTMPPTPPSRALADNPTVSSTHITLPTSNAFSILLERGGLSFTSVTIPKICPQRFLFAAIVLKLLEPEREIAVDGLGGNAIAAALEKCLKEFRKEVRRIEESCKEVEGRRGGREGEAKDGEEGCYFDPRPRRRHEPKVGDVDKVLWAESVGGKLDGSVKESQRLKEVLTGQSGTSMDKEKDETKERGEATGVRSRSKAEAGTKPVVPADWLTSTVMPRREKSAAKELASATTASQSAPPDELNAPYHLTLIDKPSINSEVARRTDVQTYCRSQVSQSGCMTLAYSRTRHSGEFGPESMPRYHKQRWNATMARMKAPAEAESENSKKPLPSLALSTQDKLRAAIATKTALERADPARRQAAMKPIPRLPRPDGTLSPLAPAAASLTGSKPIPRLPVFPPPSPARIHTGPPH